MIETIVTDAPSPQKTLYIIMTVMRYGKDLVEFCEFEHIFFMVSREYGTKYFVHFIWYGIVKYCGAPHSRQMCVTADFSELSMNQFGNDEPAERWAIFGIHPATPLIPERTVPLFQMRQLVV